MDIEREKNGLEVPQWSLGSQILFMHRWDKGMVIVEENEVYYTAIPSLLLSYYILFSLTKLKLTNQLSSQIHDNTHVNIILWIMILFQIYLHKLSSTLVS